MDPIGPDRAFRVGTKSYSVQYKCDLSLIMKWTEKQRQQQ